MAIWNAIAGPLTQHPGLAALCSIVLFTVARSVYRVFLHPLARVPGPWWAASSNSWINWHAYKGDECSVVHRYHEIYGPCLRIGPNDVDIADGTTLSAIYADRGGFVKSPCYANFDIDGHPSIFSTRDPTQRGPRAKAVVGMFSTASLRVGSAVVYQCVDRMVARLKEEAKSGKPVNVLNLTRSLALDAVSSYLFQHDYGGLRETAPHMSAGGFVDAFVAVGRFFYLPTRVVNFLDWLIETFLPDEATRKSMAKVDDFVSDLVISSENSERDQGNYPSRLLNSGISSSEAKAQCKDLIFAGTDSTGMNLATICWCLARDPRRYGMLRKEILEKKPTEAELQSLPYLRGVIKEGLRLSMANPSRLPRVVPVGGWSFRGYKLPAGTNVSVAPFEVHLNPAVFPHPNEFIPERWMDPSDEMTRDWIPFGLGPRQCIARNLATMELYIAVQRLVEEDVLRGARTLVDKIEILEWFNSKVKGERIDLCWGNGASEE